MAAKKWTRCYNAEKDELWYSMKFSVFVRDHELNADTCYAVRKGGRSRRIAGWSFEYVEGDLPLNARVWDKQKIPYPTDETGTEIIEASFDDVFKKVSAHIPDPSSDIKSFMDSAGEENTPEAKHRKLSNLLMELTIGKAEGRNKNIRTGDLREIAAVLDSYAKSMNIDPKQALDSRSIDEQVRDTLMAVITQPDTLFEAFDEQIDAIEEQMQRAVKFSKDYYDHWDNPQGRAMDMLPAADIARIDAAQNPEDPPGPKS